MSVKGELFNDTVHALKQLCISVPLLNTFQTDTPLNDTAGVISGFSSTPMTYNRFMEMPKRLWVNSYTSGSSVIQSTSERDFWNDTPHTHTLYHSARSQPYYIFVFNSAWNTTGEVGMYWDPWTAKSSHGDMFWPTTLASNNFTDFYVRPEFRRQTWQCGRSGVIGVALPWISELSCWRSASTTHDTASSATERLSHGDYFPDIHIREIIPVRFGPDSVNTYSIACYRGWFNTFLGGFAGNAIYSLPSS